MQVGGLLGDFVKGPLRGDYPQAVERGIWLHRHLDAHTNGSAVVRELLALFPPPWRRYGGIVLDVAWDHLLASRWQHYHPLPLASYCAAFYTHLATCRPWLPDPARAFSLRAPEIGLLESYADAATMPRVLARIGQQLRQPVTLAEAWPIVEEHRAHLEAQFAVVIVELQRIASSHHQRPTKVATHRQ